MAYEEYHVLDINIADEAKSQGRDISVSVDTHEQVTIAIGNSITIRTDYNGLEDLRDTLHRASVKMDEIIYDNTQRQLGNIAEDDFIKAGIDAREKQKELSAQQRHDVFESAEYNPNDPRNW